LLGASARRSRSTKRVARCPTKLREVNRAEESPVGFARSLSHLNDWRPNELTAYVSDTGLAALASPQHFCWPMLRFSRSRTLQASTPRRGARRSRHLAAGDRIPIEEREHHRGAALHSTHEWTRRVRNDHPPMGRTTLRTIRLTILVAICAVAAACSELTTAPAAHAGYHTDTGRRDATPCSGYNVATGLCEEHGDSATAPSVISGLVPVDPRLRVGVP